MTHQCEAMVPDEHGEPGKQSCRNPAYKEDRLCKYHRRKRRWINKPKAPIVITINKKNHPRKRDGSYKMVIVGQLFRDYDSAQNWMDLNWSLIIRIPGFKSACIEAYPYWRRENYYG